MELPFPVGRAPFIGRSHEVERIAAAMDAVSGRGLTILVAGEPGIGKTRLLSEVAARARQRGWLALNGHAYDSEGLPPYLLFIEPLREYARTGTPAELRTQLSAVAREVGRLVPELYPYLPNPASMPAWLPDHERYRLFEGVWEVLLTVAGSASRGLVLILDDLHWADTPSLLLFRYLARRLASTPVPLVVIATYRMHEFPPDHPLVDALDELIRERLAEQLVLQPLSLDETALLVEGLTGSDVDRAVVDTIHRETDGVPFFVEEVLRQLGETWGLAVEEGRLTQRAYGADHIAVPETLRTVIGRRLSRLSAATNKMLAAAAVVGDRFAIDVVSLMGDIDEESLMTCCDEALRAGIVREEQGSYQFAHSLIRRTIYGQLNLPRRQRLHLKAAEAIERQHEGYLEPQMAALAVHLRLAGPLANRDKLARYCLQAGMAAADAYAWEEAEAHWQAAIDAMSRDDPIPRVHWLLRLGEVQRKAGELERALESFRRAGSIARTYGMSEHLARAALGFEDTFLVTGQPRTTRGDHSVALLGEALHALGEESLALRAKVLASLARATYFEGDYQRSLEMSAAAVEIARHAGDPHVLAYALSCRRIAMWGSQDAHERRAVAEELLRLAEVTDDRELALEGHRWRIDVLLEFGDPLAAEQEIDAFARVAQSIQQPHYLSEVAAWRGTLALSRGRFGEAERLIRQAQQLGERTQNQNAVMDSTVQLILLYRDQGRLQELAKLEPTVRQYVDQYPRLPSWQALLALMNVDLGHTEEAGRVFDDLGAKDFADIPRNWLWLAICAFLVETCIPLGDTRRAKILYHLLLPHADRTVVGNIAIVCRGSVAYFLGCLAGLLSRWDDAEQHFTAAYTSNLRMGMKPLVAHVLRDHAALLLRRPDRSARDVVRAHSLLREAVHIYADLGMERDQSRGETVLAELRLESETYPDHLTHREVQVLRLVADGWTNREIADALYLSVRTVERHLSNIYGKIGIHDRRAARRYVVERGLDRFPVSGGT